ncbi:MAG: copper-translocating P-type ATPase [Bacteroidia bacterium]
MQENDHHQHHHPQSKPEPSHHQQHQDNSQHNHAHHTSQTEKTIPEDHVHHNHKIEAEKHDKHDSHAEHGGHHEGMIEDFRKRFWISLVLSIPVVILSPMVQHLIGFELIVPYQEYIVFVLASIIFFYGGWPFLLGLYNEARKNALGMMTLIGLAISVAYVYSTAVVFGLHGMDFYWELATLIVIMLLGHWLEMKSILGASRALELLVSMMPSEAHLFKNGELINVKLESLQKDDIILVKPGEKIPADGQVIEGESDVNESMLTGESKPIKKAAGEAVIGGAVNGNGSLKVQVKNTGKDSYLNKVITLVQQAQQSKSSTQHLADKAAKWLTFIALGVGVLTLITWLSLGYEFSYALERMVTVMVTSCPHALGLAIPLVVAISTAVSAKNGLLIRNRTAFENARKITLVVFDKTGTLTKGSHEVSRVASTDPAFTENELIRLVSGLEQHSEHHISKGILQFAKQNNIPVSTSQQFNYLPGLGVEGLVEGKQIKVIGPNYLAEKNISLPENLKADEATETVVYILIDEKIAGLIALADQVRDESAGAIKTLQQHGIKNLLLTGDNERVAKKVSDQLGMDGFLANVLPHEKQDHIKALQQKGDFVAMTGDGVNDAPALAQADVGIAVGSGTDVAAETADIILVNSNPEDIANLILFGRATYNKMMQNLFWATGYNVIAIPLAAGVLSPWGIVLSPAVGAVLMSLSTIIVAINAQLLRKKLH